MTFDFGGVNGVRFKQSGTPYVTDPDIYTGSTITPIPDIASPIQQPKVWDQIKALDFKGLSGGNSKDHTGFFGHYINNHSLVAYLVLFSLIGLLLYFTIKKRKRSVNYHIVKKEIPNRGEQE